MSETWMQLVFSGLLAWIAYELRQIKTELKTFVLRDDCKDDMCQHGKRLDSLDSRISRNEAALSELKGQTEVWHER